MKDIMNLCERCGKPEKGYSVTETNKKLRKVGKGPARYPVESFICSRCVQELLAKGDLGASDYSVKKRAQDSKS